MCEFIVDMVVCMFVCIFLVCVDVMFMSSAHEVSYSNTGGRGMSDVYIILVC